MSKDTFTRSEVATLLRAYIHTEGCSCCQYNNTQEDQIRHMAYELSDEGQPDFKWEETDEERQEREQRRARDQSEAWNILKEAGLNPNRND